MAYPKWFNPPLPPDCCQEDSFIHDSAFVDEPVQVGHATQIMHFSHVMSHCVIGSHCHIGHHVTIASGVMLGNNVRLLNNVSLTSGVIVEDDVYCGPSTVVSALKFIRGQAANVSSIQPTLLKRGATIGANTTIAAGFSVGQYSFVEANSVIDSHVPDFALVYGNPLQLAGWRCECGQVLRFSIADSTACARCNQKYHRRSETEIVPLTTGSTRRHDSHIQPRTSISAIERFHQ